MGLSVSVGHLADLAYYEKEDAKGLSLRAKLIFALQAMFGGGTDAASFRRELRRLNSALHAAGLPYHAEPESTEDGFSADLPGYSGLHYLRRIAAYQALGRGLPTPGNEDNLSEPTVEEYYDRASGDATLGYRHLMMHSDTEGYYLPLDFAHVLVPSPKFRVAGGMVGSVPHLRAECLELAKALGLPADISIEAPAFSRALEDQGQGEGWRRYGRESYTCAVLLGACDASLRTGGAIVFC